MKSLGGAGKIVSEAGVPIGDALSYVLSLPIASLVSGIDSMQVLEQNLKIVRSFEPLTDKERARIEHQSQKLAGDGRFELFKTSKTYDGKVHRQQHGFSTDIA
jgi:predicted aldo/keto reductase-like oxidoreductase